MPKRAAIIPTPAVNQSNPCSASFQQLEPERGVQMVREPLGRTPERARDQTDQTNESRAACKSDQWVGHYCR